MKTLNFLNAFEIAASGLAAERVRVNVATSNLANADSTRGPDGGAYRRRDPVLVAEPFADVLGATAAGVPVGVRVKEIAIDPNPGKRLFNPHHPDADGEGFVTLPNVHPVHEVVNLLSASKAYEANATALETLKGMAQRALDIAR